jgi:hypothetical protein
MKPTGTEFAVVPPRKASEVFFALLLVVPAIAVYVALALEAGVPLLAWVVIDATLLGSFVCGYGLLRALRRMRVRVCNGVLELRAPMIRERVDVGAIDLESARIVDLNQERSLRPGLKSRGVSLPGVSAGHFRGRPFAQRLFCLLTRRERVLLLRERGGRRLLLSLERPQALLDALRGHGMTAGGARR